tara:strand:+ start:152 stop:358 length:207 start_codon:yes stop_codon:yes gene_type:complete
VKNTISSIKKTIVSRYISEDIEITKSKTPNINILLNRVKMDKKKESVKKILFTLATSAGAALFCVIIF